MRVIDILKLVREYREEEEKNKVVFSWTEKQRELYKQIDKEKIFQCSSCGEMKSFFDLEYWTCDFNNPKEGITCSECYEEEMGEDL